MKWYYLAGRKARPLAVAVECDDNDIIINAPPVVKRFVGQKVERLEKWLNTKKTLM